MCDAADALVQWLSKIAASNPKYAHLCLLGAIDFDARGNVLPPQHTNPPLLPENYWYLVEMLQEEQAPKPLLPFIDHVRVVGVVPNRSRMTHIYDCFPVCISLTGKG